MFRLSFVLALVVGYLRGGSFRGFLEVEFYRVGWIFAGFGLQLGLHLGGSYGWEWLFPYAAYVHIISYGFIFYALVGNLHLRGMKSMFVGTILNFIPITTNGGKMPVSAEGLEATEQADLIPILANGESLTHQLVDDRTNFVFLADVLSIPRPFPIPTVFSIGDLLLIIGVFVLIQDIMLKKPR